MIKVLTSFFLAVLLFISGSNLYGQCIPAAPATVAGMVPGTAGSTSFMNVPTGRVIQLTSTAPNTSFLIDMCATNPGNNVPSGTNDAFLTILSANSSSATPLATLDDGCPNMAAPGYGPAVGTWVAPAAGTYFIYLTEYNAAGTNNCISNGNNSAYDFNITVTLPPSFDAAIIYDNTEYTAIPRYQITGSGLALGAVVNNLGTSAFTGVTITASVATIDDPGTSIFSVTGSPAALAAGNTATINAGNWLPPAGNGTYLVTYTAATTPADGNMANNTWTRTIDLTGDFYARDNGSIDGGLGSNGFGTIIQGAQYTFLQGGQIKEVLVNLLGGQAGDTVQLEIYQIMAGAPGATPISTSAIQVLSAAAPGELLFEPAAPFNVAGGSTYLFGIRHNSRGVNIAMAYSDTLYIPGRNWIYAGGLWGHPEDFNFEFAYIVRPYFQVCTEPAFTVGDYNCGNNSITVNVTNAGTATSGSSFSLQLNGNPTGSIPFTSTGNYTFNGLNPNQSYYVVATDGNGSCDVFSTDILTNDCFTAAQGCSDILQDGGFEQPSGTTWTETFTDLGGAPLGFPVVDPSLPLLGLQSAWLGGNGTAGSISSITQTISIPLNVTSAELAFWGLSIGCTNPADQLSITIDGSIFSAILTSANGFCDDGIWHRYLVDLTGLSAGNHQLTMTFTQNGVTGNANFFVDDASLIVCSCPAIAVGTTTTPSACGLNIGTATASPSGGTAPYSYLWSNNQTSATAQNLGVGLYTLTVTDGNGCTGVATASVGSSNGPTASVSQNNVTCFGGSNGNINLSVSGGTSPYTYLWNNNAMTSNLSNIAAGNYSCTVTDNSGCTFVASATINQPPVLQASATATNVTCNGLSNGSVNLNFSGGTPGYSFSWSNSATTEDLSGVGPNAYTVTITDSNNCQTTATATVTQPPALQLAGNILLSNASCATSCDGSITGLDATGGTMPYSYLWSNNSTNANIGNLCAGSYAATITDNNGCTTQYTTSIAAPNEISLGALPVITNASCPDACDGSVSNVVITGGTPPYTYNWSNGANTPDLSDLCAGSYTGTVTDANGCSYTTPLPLVITAPPAISIVGTVTNATNSTTGAIDITVTGGTGAYTFEWSNNATSQDISGLEPGIYTVTVTDVNDCASVEAFEVVLLVSAEDLSGIERFKTQPNPTNGLFSTNVVLKSASDIVLEIVNINGQVVLTQSAGNITEKSFLFDITHFADGVYFIRLTANELQLQQKLVLLK